MALFVNEMNDHVWLGLNFLLLLNFIYSTCLVNFIQDLAEKYTWYFVL